MTAPGATSVANPAEVAMPMAMPVATPVANETKALPDHPEMPRQPSLGLGQSVSSGVELGATVQTSSAQSPGAKHKFCVGCGQKATEHKFCLGCGTKLAVGAAATIAVPVVMFSAEPATGTTGGATASTTSSMAFQIAEAAKAGHVPEAAKAAAKQAVNKLMEGVKDELKEGVKDELKEGVKDELKEGVKDELKEASKEAAKAAAEACCVVS